VESFSIGPAFQEPALSKSEGSAVLCCSLMMPRTLKSRFALPCLLFFAFCRRPSATLRISHGGALSSAGFGLGARASRPLFLVLHQDRFTVLALSEPLESGRHGPRSQPADDPRWERYFCNPPVL